MISDIVPVTVVAATILFMARELLEALRRYKSNRRKLVALRSIISIECERLQWFIKSMRSHAENILEAIQNEHHVVLRDYRIEDLRIFINHPEGEGSSPVPKVATDIFQKYLFEAASVDRNLFDAMSELNTSLPMFLHLRAGLIYHVGEASHFLGGWCEYCLRELVDLEVNLFKLYRVCKTGNSVPHRVH